MCFLFSIVSNSDCKFTRALIALIRLNGNYPCPRCLIPKSGLAMMGGKRDLSARDSQKRLDDDVHKSDIWTAWNQIHKNNYAVNSAAVDNILIGRSLFPTIVRAIF